MPQYQGVWSLQQQMQALTSGQWATDPLFDYTTLLLQGDAGANGAQNNVFYDTSPNQFAITRNGNTTQGTFSPFSLQPGAWSNYFDGSSAYLTIADNVAFEPGTGDFTIEAWVYDTVAAGTLNVYIAHTSSGISFYRNASGKLEFAQDSVAVLATSTNNIPVNSWNHIAVSRSGTSLKLFINGVQEASVTNSTNLAGTGSLGIGASSNGSNKTTGYISNLRLVKGTAVYTATFTPSPIPLTAITNTQLLTCQSNRFVDNSSNAFTLTVNGTPSVQAFSPFAPQYQYTASGTGGSGYFDGTGDWLNSATSSNFVTTGDFTMEAWAYNTNKTTFQGIISQRSASGGPAININNSGQIEFMFGATVIATSTMPINQWFHAAISRSGSGANNISAYLNGTRVGQASITNTTATNNIAIGRYYTDTDNYYWQGYIASSRYTTSAVYSGATITVPTAPVTAVANTQLLLNYTNAGILDGTMKNNLETVGNAQVSTSVVKYGSGSMYFDGSGDYLVGPNSVNFDFGSGDFTIEFWINTTQSTAAGIVGKRTSSGAANTNWIILINQVSVVGNVVFYASDGSAYQVSALGGGLINNGVWHHVAVTRANSTFRVFVDGTQVATSTWTGAIASTSRPVYVGIDDSAAAGPFTGFLDDLRITKGVARYTQNFIPPSVALPRQ